jgi:alkyl sulfatase BDS1-like metallo-beta-lactamase superfamily hydrolase
MRPAKITAILTMLAGFAFSVSAFAESASQHFHPKGKLPSQYTIDKQQALRATLPFADKKDFEEQKKGFIAAPPYKQIMAEAGHVAWDMGKYDFLLQGKDYDSIHPSLQRQAVLKWKKERLGSSN